MASGEVLAVSEFVSARLPFGWLSDPVDVGKAAQELLEIISTSDIERTPAIIFAEDNLLGIVEKPEKIRSYDILNWQTKHNIPENLLLEAAGGMERENHG